MGETRKHTNFLVRKAQGKRQLGRPGYTWRITLKKGCEDVTDLA
jgi:hypothetical protein